ncbi:hypothetical protein [Modestobacter italicus]|uniref:hypothetical protein n=1 Tax=Modestobacter italicus (strain DSM 44449 / CECT 9708 / BC 501) TaxID=2732864 RepID=UPI001C940594|nr:hypothetical protein [Modestobacter italicus]
MTYWVGSISFEQRDNWQICKRESLFGSNTPTALGVRAGDELFIWGSKQGWLARCRATEDARRPAGTEEVPWPDPQHYKALIPVEVLDEPAAPVAMAGPELKRTVGIDTVRLPQFPRIDLQRAEHLTILLAENFEPHRARDRTPAPLPVDTDEPLLKALTELKVDRQLGQPTPYQYLVLLWAISKAIHGRERMQPFSDVRDELRNLLGPFAVGESQPEPELPWFALRKSPWWQLFGAPDGPVPRGGRDFVRTENPVAGLARAAHDRVRDDQAFRSRAIELLTAPVAEHPALQTALGSLFPAGSPAPEVHAGEDENQEAVDLLTGLIGRRLESTTGAVNEVLAVEPPNVLVATSKSPQGQLVPIAEVQTALDLLGRDGQVTVDVPTLGHRSSFVGAVLASREDVVVAGAPSVVSLLDADSRFAGGKAQGSGGLHLKPGEQIKRTALHQRYGGSGQGGISPSSQSPNILIFTDPKTGEQHGYFDGWQADGLFHYTGEGQRGDQLMIRGNRAIVDHRATGRALQVFEGSKDVVRYMGRFELDEREPCYETDAPETGDGPVRKVIVFRLRSLTASAPAERSPLASVTVGPIVADVPIEQQHTEKAWTNPKAEPIEAERREAKLVLAFEAHLRARGRAVSRKRVLPPGEHKPMYTDLYDDTVMALVEAKGTTSREAVRMALGQLADYSRFVDATHRAVLLPGKPRPDLQDLAASQDVAVIWQTGDGFESTAPRLVAERPT